MIKCIECEKESKNGNVCTNCGLVTIDRPLDSRPDRIIRKDRDGKTDKILDTIRDPLSPDIQYLHQYAKSAKNVELNRALYRQRRKVKKDSAFYYMRSYEDIKRICSFLRLTTIIRNEALNIRLQLEKLGFDEFKKKAGYKHAACVKLACMIHDYPFDEKELIQSTRIYHIIKKDEKDKMKGNIVKKTVDRAFRKFRNDLKIKLEIPDVPRFISFVCNILELPQSFESEIYQKYASLKRFFESQYSLKGYILAIIYLFGKKYDIKIADLEKKFGISSTTLLARRKELLWKGLNVR